MSHSLSMLEKQFQRIAQIDHASTFLGWDQMVMMPDAGMSPRSAAVAELASIRHEILTAPQMKDWLQQVSDELEQGKLDSSKQAHLYEMKRTWQQSAALPADLVHAQVLAGSKCEHGWRTQKAANDWNGFLLNFREVVKLSREEAQCRQALDSQRLTTPYDAMLDLHCAGDSQSLIGGIFSELKKQLPELLAQVMEHQSTRKVSVPGGEFPIDQQQALSEDLMKILGFDFNAGRLDVSMHPFSTGVKGDQRITTRYRSSDFADALQATAHETGHASYESGLPDKWRPFPVGSSRNMCIHESQSLYFEKHLFLSRTFGRYFLPLVHRHLPASEALTADDLWHSQTRVQPSHIRVEADEVTYPLHVMLRYDIESGLINGELEAEQIPDLWESLLHQYLGLSTDGNHSLGCLQDIHWTDGAFGYFPSYTMGAVNAAQISARIKQQNPDWQEQLERGELAFARNWLNENIWQRGSEISSQEIIKAATGQTTSASFFIQHLRQRYLQELD